jgi:hypothetical protein
MGMGKWLGYVRGRVVERELRMRDGQNYRRQIWHMDHPTREQPTGSVKFSIVVDEGDEDEDVSKADPIPRIFWLFIGCVLTFSFIELGVLQTVYAILFAVAAVVVSQIVGRAAKKKVAEMERDKPTEDEPAIDPDYSDLDDIDLDLSAKKTLYFPMDKPYL